MLKLGNFGMMDRVCCKERKKQVRPIIATRLEGLEGYKDKALKCESFSPFRGYMNGP